VNDYLLKIQYMCISIYVYLYMTEGSDLNNMFILKSEIYFNQIQFKIKYSTSHN
jgi:hypothetical protein